MDVHLYTSKQEKNLLIVNGYSYYEKRRLKSSEIVWQCSKEKKCTAKVYTMPNNTSISRLDNVHCHEKDENLPTKILNQAAKRKAEDILERPSKIIHTVIAENPTSLENLTSRNINNLKQSIYRKRRKQIPILPKNRVEAIKKLLEMEVKTVKGEEFLLYADADSGIVIFSCDSNLEFLIKCKKIYMDGTFKYCAKLWLQLFTIHGIENGKYVPLIFCLLPDKKECTYAKLFKTIIEKCFERNLCFQPCHLVVDFENAIHSAIKATWPNAALQGCKFHLHQSWHRKILNLGLGTEFRCAESNEIGQWLKKIFGLSYLKPNDVGECFALDIVPIQPPDSRVSEFVDYLVENYIDELEAKFPPTMWAKADASAENTTNACESFHSHFNACFYHTHPHIFHFVEVLLQCQTDSYIRMSSTKETNPVSKTILQRRENLHKMITMYLEGNLTKIDLVKFASHKFKPKSS